MKIASLVVCLLILATADRARAQSTSAQAETEFKRAKELVKEGKLAEACAAFDRSEKLEHALATVLNQASCREKLGQLASAWALYNAAKQAANAPDDTPFRDSAVSHMTELEPRLSKLTIAVSPDARIPQLTITRNTAPVDARIWGQAASVDGGTYTIAARAPGRIEWRTTVTIKPERDVQRVEVPKLEAPAPEPPRVTPPAVTAEPEPMVSTTAASRPPAPSAKPGRSKLPYIVGGGAVALFGTAVGLELWGRSINGELEDPRTTSMTQTDREEIQQSANKRRYTAEALAGAGAVCAGVAVWLYLRDGGRETQTVARARSLSVTPYVVGERAGLLFSRTW